MKGRNTRETYGVSPPIDPLESDYVRASAIKKAVISGILVGGIMAGSVIYFIKNEEITAERKSYVTNIENLVLSFDLVSQHEEDAVKREILKAVSNSIRSYSEKIKEKYGFGGKDAEN